MKLILKANAVQCEILELLKQGKSTESIARKLRLTGAELHREIHPLLQQVSVRSHSWFVSLLQCGQIEVVAEDGSILQIVEKLSKPASRHCYDTPHYDRIRSLILEMLNPDAPVSVREISDRLRQEHQIFVNRGTFGHICKPLIDGGQIAKQRMKVGNTIGYVLRTQKCGQRMPVLHICSERERERFLSVPGYRATWETLRDQYDEQTAERYIAVVANRTKGKESSYAC